MTCPYAMQITITTTPTKITDSHNRMTYEIAQNQQHTFRLEHLRLCKLSSYTCPEEAWSKRWLECMEYKNAQTED